MGKQFFTVLFCFLGFCVLQAQNQVDILIIDGGAGGTSAGIKAARMGTKVQIIEATPSLGGMLTSAGVSAIDGNHEMPSGIWGEFRQKLREHYGGAKAFTKGFVYYIQNELGFKNLRVAEEFPTEDNFPMIPYDREGRRIKGKVFLTVDRLERAYHFNLYKTGIALGDYPIDHHRDKNPEGTPEIAFINIRVPSYTIPLG